MAKITHTATLEAQSELRAHIAMTIATLRAMDLAIKRDYRGSIVNLGEEAELQVTALSVMARQYKKMPAKEKP